VQLADNVITVKTLMQKFEAPAENGGFGDITKDPDLYQMAGNLANTMRARGEFDDTNWMHYQRVGDAVRKWRDSFVQRYATEKKEPVADMTEKAVKKRSIVNINPANKKKESNQPTTMKTPVEIAREGIKDIMRARGQ